MEIPWSGDRCIICSATADLTLEHILPAALLGDLTCRFLCHPCNSTFGAQIDKGAKGDPMIRLAARELGGVAPSIASRMEDGQRYLVRTEVGLLKAVRKNGDIAGSWQHLADGSSIAPEDIAEISIRGRLKAEGLSPADIDNAIARYAEAPEGEYVDLSPRWKARKVAAYLHGPDLAMPFADPLLFVKIAFEFLALLVGGAIYAADPHLDELKTALREGKRDSDAFSVERLTADKAAPFHGIAFEGNSPHAKFQIRLFGRTAYRVHLHRIALMDFPLFAYTHDLATGEHWHNLDEEALAAIADA